MAREIDVLDRRPGPVPEIRHDRGNITFVLTPDGIPKGERLIIRCDAEGELWVSAQSKQK